jgi:hypothetical protein
MRIISLTVLSVVLFFLSDGSFAQVVPTVPKDGFNTYESLKYWATSHWGGGYITEVDFDGQKVYCTIRSFTSGRASSEITFFIQRGEKYTPFLMIPTQMRDLNIVVGKDPKTNETVVFVNAFSQQDGSVEQALSLTKWMIPE